MNIKKGDTVKIIRGKDGGKTGVVQRAFPENERVIVEGMNLFKKRVRPKQQRQKGETVNVPRPMSASNVMLICKNCKKPVRAGYRTEGETKVRYCRKCDAGL